MKSLPIRITNAAGKDKGTGYCSLQVAVDLILHAGVATSTRGALMKLLHSKVTDPVYVSDGKARLWLLEG
jgi:hypothetical protein